MTIVCLVRHATHGLVDKVLCGRMAGVSLGAEGRRQADRLAHRLCASHAVAVLTSPLERARETAEPIARLLGVTPHVEPDLNEIDVGDWTGQPFEALRKAPDWINWNTKRSSVCPPNGEFMRDAQRRICRVLERLADEERGLTILVTHGDVIRAAVLATLEMPIDSFHRFDVDPASITTLSLWRGAGKVVSLNERLTECDTGAATGEVH